MYKVEVVDFDNEVYTFEVEADSPEAAQELGEATVKNEFYFYEPLKALRFAFLLRKRLEGSFTIPKGVYNKLLAAVKAAKPAPAPEAEQGESAPVPTATESTTAPKEAQPAKKSRRRSTKKESK